MHSLRSSRLALRSLVLAASAVLAVSCADPVAPRSTTSSSLITNLPLGGGGGLVQTVDTTVTALQRAVPLLTDVSASATIGPDGGSIVIPASGFRLDVPKNAVFTPTTITVTAVAGSTIAYECEPAGTVFNKRLVVTQDLSLTSIASSLLGRQLTGAYFKSRSDLLPDGTVNVYELEPSSTSLTSLTTQFTVGHFSGYVIGVD